MNVKEINPITVAEALKIIANNKTQTFIWLVVVNEKGCIFELSGTEKELQAVIPYYDENGNIVFYDNGYSTSKYYIREYEVSTPTKRYQLENPLTRDEFIMYIKHANFKEEVLVRTTNVVMVEKIIDSYSLK